MISFANVPTIYWSILPVPPFECVFLLEINFPLPWQPCPLLLLPPKVVIGLVVVLVFQQRTKQTTKSTTTHIHKGKTTQAKTKLHFVVVKGWGGVEEIVYIS